MRASHKLSVLLLLGCLISLICLQRQPATASAQDDTKKEVQKTLRLSKPDELFHLEMVFRQPVSASQLVTSLLPYNLDIVYVSTQWEEHKGWHFRKNNQTLQETVQEFSIQHKNFLEGVVRDLGNELRTFALGHKLSVI